MKAFSKRGGIGWTKGGSGSKALKAHLNSNVKASQFEFQCQSIKRVKMHPNKPNCQHDNCDDDDNDDDDDDNDSLSQDCLDHDDDDDDMRPFHKHSVS